MAEGLKPRLRITAPTGATLTASFQDETVELSEVEAGVFEGDVDRLAPWTVTGVLDGKTKTTTVEVTDVGRFAGEVSFLPPKDTLENTSWADISTISEAGLGADYWSIGDTKSIALSGTCGTLSLNTTLYCYIIGFDHNSDKEGTGIHFGTWKDSSGKDLCLIDSYYDKHQSYNGTKYFQHNHWGPSGYGKNYGGWKGSEMRYDILGSTNVAPSGYGSANSSTSRVGYDPSNYDIVNSPVANTLMACLPAALRAVMKPMTKYTDNYGYSSNVADHVTTSVDYLPLLAEFEIFGARSYANEYEKNYQAQYEYFANSNSKVKYRHSSTGLTANWWERSPITSNDDIFCYVYKDGTAGNAYASNSRGLAPIFKV